MKKAPKFSPVGYDALVDSYDYMYGQSKDQELYVSLKWLNNRLKNGSSILDVGCGTGRVAQLLSKNFKVTGIDNSPQMIKLSRLTAPKATFLEMNLQRLNFTEDQTHQFDTIVCFFTLLHVETAIFVRTLRSLLKLLLTGGYFILSMVLGDYDKDANLMGKKFHYTAYEENKLLTILKKNSLKVIKVQKQKFQPRSAEASVEDQIFIYCQL